MKYLLMVSGMLFWYICLKMNLRSGLTDGMAHLTSDTKRLSESELIPAPLFFYVRMV